MVRSIVLSWTNERRVSLAIYFFPISLGRGLDYHTVKRRKGAESDTSNSLSTSQPISEKYAFKSNPTVRNGLFCW